MKGTLKGQKFNTLAFLEIPEHIKMLTEKFLYQLAHENYLSGRLEVFHCSSI